MLGQVIGNHLLVRRLGEGGMGAVYLGEHTLLGRRAAIKMLHPSLSSRQDIVTRFFNEARAATAIADPGIVAVFDFGFHTDGSAFLVMELLDGEALDVRLAKQPLALVDAVRIGRQVATSLAAAHAKGIVHRDLKPENIYLVRDAEVMGGERAKILDFGIAKLATTDVTQRTQHGAIMGTPAYMSPEQCRGAGEVDHRTDIYALGCLLYHSLTGRQPFVYEGLGEMIAAQMCEVPLPPSTHAPWLPRSIDALVLKCLAKSAADRYQSMTELASALGTLITADAATMNATLMAPSPSGAAPSYPGSVPPQAPYPGSVPPQAPYPGSVPPQASHPGSVPPQATPVPSRTPTTLGSSAAAMTNPPTAAPPRRRGGLVAIGAVLAIGAAVAVAVAWPSGAGPSGAGAGAEMDAGRSGAGDVPVSVDRDAAIVPVDAGVAIDAAAPSDLAPIDAGTPIDAAPPIDAGRHRPRPPRPDPVKPDPTVDKPPPPHQPKCRLDENGVPLERC